MNFSVEIAGRAGNQIQPPSEVGIEPVALEWAAVGGPKHAEIRAYGRREALTAMLNWAGYRITVRNTHGQAVWWGYVAEVLVGLGAYSIGVSLETMYNSIAVAYTYTDVNNELQRGTTDWHEDGGSVATYGRKQLLYSHADLESVDEADDLAQSLLERHSTPQTFIRSANSKKDTATLRCWGWWSRTMWEYYKQLQGREAHESYFAEQALGVQWVGSNVSFLEDGNTVYPQMGEHGFEPGNKVTISGSQHNDGTKTVASATQVERETYTSDTIMFGASNDLYSPELGEFARFDEGDLIQVGGADNPSNNGIWAIDEMDLPHDQQVNGLTVDHIELDTEVIVPENNGFTVTINRNGYFQTEEDLEQETPSPGNVTLTAWGQRIAQRFQLSEDAGDWSLNEVLLRVRKVGEPSDGVRVSIQTGSAGSPSGSMLDSTSIPSGSIGTEAGWETFTLSGSLTLTYGQDYWLVVQRTGAPDADNFYVIGVDDSGGYVPLGSTPPKGNYQVHTGGSWQSAPSGETSLAFQVIGKRDTGQQIREMLLANGPFTVVSTLTTGRLHPLYRDGDNLTMDEIEPLLERGDSSGIRLVAYVRLDRSVQVTLRPSRGNLLYGLAGNGDIFDAHGEPLPPGLSIAGRWVRLEEPGLTDIPAERLAFFVEEATYDVESGEWMLHPQDAPDPYNLGPEQG